MSKVIQIIEFEKERDDILPMPWRSTATCFNFFGVRADCHSTNIYSEDLEHSLKKMSQANCSEVKCLIIKADNITDFSFISCFENLKQLYIYSPHITDLSFIKPLIYLSQICLCEVYTNDLSPLVELIHNKRTVYEKANRNSEGETHEGFSARMKLWIEGLYLDGKLNEEAFSQIEQLYDPDICRKQITAFGLNIC